MLGGLHSISPFSLTSLGIKPCTIQVSKVPSPRFQIAVTVPSSAFASYRSANMFFPPCDRQALRPSLAQPCATSAKRFAGIGWLGC